MRKLLISLLAVLAASCYGQNTVMVNNSNSTITYPTNFWTANAMAGRAGLGLGSAATNPSTAFQPASSNLTNLAANNGSSLTNLNVSLTNLSGTLAISSGGTGATNADMARTNLGLRWSGLTNTNYVAMQTALFTTNRSLMGNDGLTAITWGGSNVSFYAPIAFSGIGGATTAAQTRTNFGLGWSGLTNTNASGFRSDLGLSASWLTNTVASNFLTDIGGITTNSSAAGFTNFPSNMSFGVNSTNSWVNKNWRTLPIRFGEPTVWGAWAVYTEFDTSSKFALAYALTSGNTNPVLTDLLSVRSNSFTLSVSLDFSSTNFSSTTRTNLGLGAAWLTNTVAANLRSDIGLSWAALTNTNAVNFRSDLSIPWAGLTNVNASGFRTSLEIPWSGLTNTNSTNMLAALGGFPIGSTLAITNGGTGATNSATARTNIGLPWAGLTNTTASGFRTSLELTWSGLTNSNNTAFQAAIFPAVSGSVPTNTNAPTPDAWLQVNVGGTNFFLPLYQ